jgi:hypothetical protein
MMKATHLREFDYRPLIGSHDRPWNRAVLRQRSMWARVMIIVEVALENCPQMSFADDDNLIQAFPADCPDQPFGVRILPRRVRGGQRFLDTEGSYAPGKLGTVYAIAVAQQVIWRRHKRELVDDLLSGPPRRGRLGDRKMQDLPALMRKHHKDKQDAEGDPNNRSSVFSLLSAERSHSKPFSASRSHRRYHISL